jgi:hypothetical protein
LTRRYPDRVGGFQEFDDAATAEDAAQRDTADSALAARRAAIERAAREIATAVPALRDGGVETVPLQERHVTSARVTLFSQMKFETEVVASSQGWWLDGDLALDVDGRLWRRAWWLIVKPGEPPYGVGAVSTDFTSEALLPHDAALALPTLSRSFAKRVSASRSYPGLAKLGFGEPPGFVFARKEATDVEVTWEQWRHDSPERSLLSEYVFASARRLLGR